MKLRARLHGNEWSAIVKYELSTAQPIYAFQEIDFPNCESDNALTTITRSPHYNRSKLWKT